MDAFFLSPSSFSILFLLTIFQLSYARDDFHFTSCAPFDCGNLVNISYPFWTHQYNRPSYCGYGDEGYKLKCRQNQPPVMTLSSQEFYVLHLNRSHSLLTIRRVELNNTCPQPILMNNAFNYTETAENIKLVYDCRSRGGPNHRFSCRKGGKETSLMFFKEDENECIGNSEQVEIPIGKKAFDDLIGGISTVNESLVQPFDIRYFAYDPYCKHCKDSGGRCGHNQTETSAFVCNCRDKPHLLECNQGRSGSNSGRKLAIAFGGGSISLLVTCIIAFYFRRRIPFIIARNSFWKFTKSDTNIEAFIRNNGTLSPKRYSYSDVKKITKSFKEKLGKGGYGTVYKGKLLDGHLVAVKLLNTTKGNGEEFINEVASISRTSHVNIVSLLGFCSEGRKRALIYEFMPNGSLELFIHKKDIMNDRPHLSSEELFKIAIGIARGLEYLHRGCNTRILHFDIKPHNILLDENFLPKIADFGLSKLCTTKDSIVSMLEARGTIGYIAPEVFCRNVGGVSHKSDVYSYGMMILEMVGGRKNIDVGVSRNSEVYFPHWIYGYVVQDNIEPQLLDLRTRDETKIARKMILVGLWCIQMNPLDRPSMSKVIEMLEGSLEVLQIPPKPYMSSPSRSPVDSTFLTLS
ncbi:LEAF RUST 10 DISEASE-RESISTANCE LOCUS RECEPTOR-LIKE PROTEIN KINASE-like 2.1 [Gossypium raimondii]|uniref:non-specific serine/threonine protein kinase n=1 Tax=Gossypium raimondii TaxID=29730 RepID=A0A0D2RXU1_GOSRA|nr:LEAF RUST 10 DISEASE-RESISTANCE LOCUS RECEPTOR-LIKE PROTEIN KINASE-like 2.1 [Gossypium raimondii]KJB34321.1 hypothetical protein B456_006G059700 [Gossypium raimondii]